MSAKLKVIDLADVEDILSEIIQNYNYKENSSDKMKDDYIQLIFNEAITFLKKDKVDIEKHPNICKKLREITCKYPNVIDSNVDFIFRETRCYQGKLCNEILATGGKPAKKEKIHVLGRDRIVIKKGRTCFVTYNKNLIPLSKARVLEKQKANK